MRVLDNISELLGDDLKHELARGGKLKIAAATFSIFAFEALREQLESISDLEFIFTQPTFVPEKHAGGVPVICGAGSIDRQRALG